MDLNRRDILLINVIISTHLKLANLGDLPPQADLDLAEGPLRTALQTKQVRDRFLINLDRDRELIIPAERWSEQDFWIAAHTDPFRWQGEYWHMMLDADDLVATDIRAPFSQERNWIEQAPGSIKKLGVYPHLLRMLELWPLIRDPSRDLKGKRILRLLEENGRKLGKNEGADLRLWLILNSNGLRSPGKPETRPKRRNGRNRSRISIPLYCWHQISSAGSNPRTRISRQRVSLPIRSIGREPCCDPPTLHHLARLPNPLPKTSLR